MDDLFSTLLWFRDPRCQEESLVGGKAAQLARLAARYPVPDGFCLPIGHDCSAEAVGEMYDRLSPSGEPVAVRSSAPGEDGAAHSYAGQYDTLLNVRGRSAVIDAIHQCRASASSTRIEAYRETHQLAQAPSVAVIVQRLVRADAAFVAFSRDPIDASRDDVVVNATWGLGEPLVGGTVDPDTFR